MPDFIYPRDFFQAQTEEQERGLCFVLMPFADEYRRVYDGVVKPTLEESGMTSLRADDIYDSRPILVTVMEQISKAELVIADLSGRNPNVFYEVGLAHLAKPNERVVLMSRTMEDVPFDLRHLRLIIYEDSPTGFDELKTKLARTLQSLELGHPPEELVLAAAAEEESVETPQDHIALSAEWDCSNVTVGFPQSEESSRGEFGAFVGRVSAGLLKWFEFEDIQQSGNRIEFPDGRIINRFSQGTALQVARGQRVALDELAEMTAQLYNAVTYEVDEPFEPGRIAKHLKTVDLPITYVSGSLITVAVDRQRTVGFIDLYQSDEHMAVELRAPESWSYRTSDGIVPFRTIMDYLVGKLGSDDFVAFLQEHL